MTREHPLSGHLAELQVALRVVAPHRVAVTRSAQPLRRNTSGTMSHHHTVDVPLPHSSSSWIFRPTSTIVAMPSWLPVLLPRQSCTVCTDIGKSACPAVKTKTAHRKRQPAISTSPVFSRLLSPRTSRITGLHLGPSLVRGLAERLRPVIRVVRNHHLSPSTVMSRLKKVRQYFGRP